MFHVFFFFFIPQGENSCCLFGLHMQIYLLKAICDNYKTKHFLLQQIVATIT